MSADKSDTIFTLVVGYLVGGMITLAAMGLSGVDPDWAQCTAIMLFWPLFALKYLIIGIQMVLYAGVDLLV